MTAGPFPPPPGRPPAIDWAEALARMDGDADMLREICGIFREDAPGIRARLAAAAATGDLASLQFAAHSLKGASATLSAGEVATLAGQLEQCAGEGQDEASRALAAAAIAAFDRVLHELEDVEAAIRRVA